MIWFWVVAALLTVAYAAGILLGFFDDFESRDWTTLVAATSAFLISVLAIVVRRTPRPHWEFVKIDRKEPLAIIVAGDSRSRSRAAEARWMARFRQVGPGSAESVSTAVRYDNGPWTAPERLGQEHHELPRGTELAVHLATGKRLPSGTYQVRVTWRELPNTRRMRSKVITVAKS